jgi:hypothetical protein
LRGRFVANGKFPFNYLLPLFGNFLVTFDNVWKLFGNFSVTFCNFLITFGNFLLTFGKVNTLIKFFYFVVTVWYLFVFHTGDRVIALAATIRSVEATNTD